MNTDKIKPEVKNTTTEDGWVFQASKGESWCNGRDHNYYVRGYNTITQQVAPTSSVRAHSEEYAIQLFQLQLPINGKTAIE